MPRRLMSSSAHWPARHSLSIKPSKQKRPALLRARAPVDGRRRPGWQSHAVCRSTGVCMAVASNCAAAATWGAPDMEGYRVGETGCVEFEIYLDQDNSNWYREYRRSHRSKYDA